MATDNAFSWDRVAAWYQTAAKLPTDTVTYGFDIPGERELRLLGDVTGKRILDLGCGGGQNVIALAKQGARAIGVDPSAEQIAYGRRLADGEEVRVELRQGDLADLAFLTPASVDLALSSLALAYVDDVSRVFRQVHRVLKTDAPLVVSVPHPLALAIDDDGRLTRRYSDRTPVNQVVEGAPFSLQPLTVSALYTTLVRANFRVDVILEPESTAGPRSRFWRDIYTSVPPVLIIRARKLGV